MQQHRTSVHGTRSLILLVGSLWTHSFAFLVLTIFWAVYIEMALCMVQVWINGIQTRWSNAQYREIASTSCVDWAWIPGTVPSHAPLTCSTHLKTPFAPSSQPPSPLSEVLCHPSLRTQRHPPPPGPPCVSMCLTYTTMPGCSDGGAMTLKNIIKYFLHQSRKERQNTEELVQMENHREAIASFFAMKRKNWELQCLHFTGWGESVSDSALQ